MCVIVLVQDKRPDSYMIDKMWDKNPHGGGVAYIDGDEVVWEKGLNKDEMHELIGSLPMPFVAHFRVASSGGQHPELCHPFPIAPDASIALEGRFKGNVLFHNGDWKEWRSSVWNTVVHKPVTIPYGREWSDTRAIAFLSSVYGENVLDFIGQKGVVFGPNRMEIFGGDTGWVEVDGIWCSNNRFALGLVDRGGVVDTRPIKGPGAGVTGEYCLDTNCWRQDIDGKGYCPAHRPGGSAFNRAVQAMGGSGGTTQVTPFRPSLKPENFLSLEQAEQAFTEGEISKNFLKKCRAYFEKLNMQMHKKKQSTVGPVH